MNGTLIVEKYYFRLVIIKICTYILSEKGKSKEFLLWEEGDRLVLLDLLH